MSAILSSKVLLTLAYRLPADLAQQEKSGIPWWFWVLMGATLIILFWMLFNRPKEKESDDIEEGPLETNEPVEASQRSSAFEMEDDEIDFGPYAHEPEPSEAPTYAEASRSPFLDAVEEDTSGPQGFNMDFLKADDFTIIEGIGPKIAKLLNQADIHTFKQLSNLDPEGLLVMLAAAGIFMTDPATWPDQARLAANGQWDELKRLQDSLNGGQQVS
jgi:predicted flap endonuclease-1-like 5' DNA nuclease